MRLYKKINLKKMRKDLKRKLGQISLSLNAPILFMPFQAFLFLNNQNFLKKPYPTQIACAFVPRIASGFTKTAGS